MLCHHQKRFIGVVATVRSVLSADTTPSLGWCGRDSQIWQGGSNFTRTQNIHVDFVSCISAHHVQNRQAAARMVVDPFSKVQRESLMNHDRLALRNLALDFLGGYNSVARHCWCKRVGMAAVSKGDATIYTAAAAE